MPRRLISLVDDDASLRRSVENLLASAGFEVAVFESAEAFLVSAALAETALLILDVHLVGMSGLELMSRLASTSRPLPTLLLTADTGDFVRARASALGALVLLAKPFRPGELLSWAAGVLRGGAPP